jgi:acyl-CoA dehydrogenase
MIDFEITEEQKALIETARRFARELITPIAAECDREARFPRNVFEEAWKIGLVNPTLPTEYGGAGLSDVDSSFITEELAYGCSGIQTSMTANTLGMTPLKLAGTEAQKKKYLSWLAQEPIFASYATTEPGAGSDVAGLTTRAVKEADGGYVLNGQKCWITNASLASFFTIFATENAELRHKGIGAFLVHRDAKGLSVGKHEDKMGQRASDTAVVSRTCASRPPRCSRLQGTASSWPWRPSTRRAPTSARSRRGSCAVASTNASRTRKSERPSASRSPSTSSFKR